MVEYSDGEVAVIQRFVDLYRTAPEAITRGECFIGFRYLNLQEQKDIGVLVDKRIVERRVVQVSSLEQSQFFRFSNGFGDLGRLIAEGKIALRWFYPFKIKTYI